MGKGLARRIAATGEIVMMAGRDLEKVKGLAADIPGTIQPAPITEAADGEVIILAVPFSAIEHALAEVGDVTGKVLVDITNPLGSAFAPGEGAAMSGAEHVQSLAPRARLVKAFNTLFSDVLEIGLSEPDTPPQVLICGDHEYANQRIGNLVETIGFRPLECGPLKNARYLEAIGAMTIQLGGPLGHGRRIVPRFVEY